MAHAISLNTDVEAHGLSGLFARLRQTFADLHAYQKIRDELDALSDRELADIGLSRLGIRDVAREAVYGD